MVIIKVESALFQIELVADKGWLFFFPEMNQVGRRTISVVVVVGGFVDYCPWQSFVFSLFSIHHPCNLGVKRQQTRKKKKCATNQPKTRTDKTNHDSKKKKKRERNK